MRITASYLKIEIERHFKKIVDRSKLTKEEIDLSLEVVYSRISFISDSLIPFEEYIKAMRLVRGIDPDDVTFVALANYMDQVDGYQVYCLESVAKSVSARY